MPLPKPNADESRNEFVSRCMLDTNIRNDFDTIEQRVAVCNSLYTDSKEEKASTLSADKFEGILSKAEVKPTRDLYKYYKAQYEQVIDIVLKTGTINQASVIQIFKSNDLKKIYEDMYAYIGVYVATRVQGYYKKYVKKADESAFIQLLRANLIVEGLKNFDLKGEGVINTARRTAMLVVSQIATDEMFQGSGEVVRARMLRKRFDQYAIYQARRVVRTESTWASNYANYRMATQIFPPEQLEKTWITAMDSRVRPSRGQKPIYNHRVMNGVKVPALKYFQVGMDTMFLPADPKGRAGNVINCRCTCSFTPIEDAQTIGTISNIGFGLGVTAEALAESEGQTGNIVIETSSNL